MSKPSYAATVLANCRKACFQCNSPAGPNPDCADLPVFDDGSNIKNQESIDEILGKTPAVEVSIKRSGSAEPLNKKDIKCAGLFTNESMFRNGYLYFKVKIPPTENLKVIGAQKLSKERKKLIFWFKWKSDIVVITPNLDNNIRN
uniref:ShKT domain-containing protein n=1 Tax=Rhabditophanes sp. KR3021 TaxID=114890 RepID=A0AC35UBE5_9BILA